MTLVAKGRFLVTAGGPNERGRINETISLVTVDGCVQTSAARTN